MPAGESFEAVEIYPRTSLVYEYGVRLDGNDDIESVIETQARLAHETYNRMVEVCRNVFNDILAFARRHDPEIEKLERRIAEYGDQWKAAKAKDDRDNLKKIAGDRAALRREWRERVWAVRNRHRKQMQGEFLARVDIGKKGS